jgi:hypothetical protein
MFTLLMRSATGGLTVPTFISSGPTNDNSSRMVTYKTLIRGWTEPETVCMASYTAAPHLRATMPRRRLMALTRFRTSSHRLRVETDRYLPELFYPDMTNHYDNRNVDALLAEGGFLVAEVFFTELVESPGSSKLAKEGVDFFEEGGVVQPKRHGPLFFANRREDGTRFLGLLLGVLPNAHLIVEKRVGFSLNNLQHGGGFFFQSEDLGVFDVRASPDFPRGSLPNGESFSRLIQVGD